MNPYAGSVSKELDRLNLNDHHGAIATERHSEDASARSKDVFDYGRPATTAERHIYSDNVASRNMSAAPPSFKSGTSTRTGAPQIRTENAAHGAIPPQINPSTASIPRKPLPEQAATQNPSSPHDDQARDSHPLRHKDGHNSLNETDIDSKPSSSNAQGPISSTASTYAKPLPDPPDGAVEHSSGSSGIHLDDTTDTVEHTHTAPAVTRETIQPIVQHIRTKQVTRDIHNTDIHHRILPINVVEHLPARHFVHSSNGQLIEVPESSVEEILGLR